MAKLSLTKRPKGPVLHSTATAVILACNNRAISHPQISRTLAAEIYEASAIMGVPFEALLPYAVILSVRTSLILLRIYEARALTHTIDVRRHRCGPFSDQDLAKRGEETKAFDRSMGQAECAYLVGRHNV